MISDSTGYYTSTGSSSLYSSCAAIPAISNNLLTLFDVHTKRHNCNANSETNILESVTINANEGLIKRLRKECSIKCENSIDSSLSDLDYLEDIGSKVQFRHNICGKNLRESRFYGVHVCDDNEYDQCPIESYLQSLLSSRRNTAPFASPSTLLNYSGNIIDLPHDPKLSSSLKSRIGFDQMQDDTLNCSALSDSTDYPSDMNRRSLLQDSSEYHRGNSIRLRTIPLPIRANIVATNAFEKNDQNSKQLFVQNIHVEIPLGTIPRNPELVDIENVFAVTPENSVQDFSSLSQNSEEIILEEEDFYTIIFDDNKRMLRQNEEKPPSKPPRGKFLMLQDESIEITTKDNNGKNFVIQGPEKPVSTKMETYNKDKSINMMDANKKVIIPKKSILKNVSKPKCKFADPNEALFGPIEHIYETIDSDPSTDDDRSSVPESHVRPVSFASTMATTITVEQKPKRQIADLRPALPDRPFCWPFTLFPPDMTFCPRSLHAYHRSSTFEAGLLLYDKKSTVKTSSDFSSDLHFSSKNSVKLNGITKTIARMPSFLSKAM